MAKQGKKKPAKGFDPSAAKEPSLGVDPDQAAQTERLSWRLSMLDMGGGCLSWKECGRAKLEEIHQKLCHHEKMSLKEFYARRGTNKIPVYKLKKVARDRLDQLKLDDIEELFEIRLSGKGRIWGTMTGPIFNLLWWDPNHEAYEVEKKHT
jgi:hypothetical protein